MNGRWGTVLAALRSSLADRLFPRRVDSVDALAGFVGQRSAYVAQTALYGYLKTRMGTRFPQYFEDPAFSASIKTAAVRVFVACAGDLTVYAVALAGRDAGLEHADQAALARRCFGGALAAGLEREDAAALPDGTIGAFAARAAGTDWADAARPAAFAGSADALIRAAPVSDEFKRLDAEIVRNSIRLRWIDVREELARRLDAGAVCADWRARHAS